MELKYKNLFTPLQVGTLTFRNRILAAPTMMCQVRPDGTPDDELIAYYEGKARGGAAQVTIGDTPVDEDHGVTIARHIVLTPSNLPRLSELARAIKSHGAVASFELNHGGRVAGKDPWGPVSYVKPNGVAVTGMTEEMMEYTADKFAKAALLVKQAGFDMCLLHGAHGWLLDQFLSPLTNTRTDEYGGSLENRAKFPLMVIDRVRKAVGPKFPIEYRIGAEIIPGGLEIEEVIEFLKMAQDKIDLAHISAGLDTDGRYAVRTHPTMFLPHMVNTHYAETVKKAGLKIPVVAIGSITSAAEAEEIIASGKADAVAMVRSLIADPDLPNKARQGRDDETIPCMRCLDCLALMQVNTQFSCAANPRTGHEFRLNATEKPAASSKNVVVVGGGPAGMKAAVTAAQRGHKVTLLEKTDALGGLLKFTDYDDLKIDLRHYKNYLLNMVGKLDIDVRLNTEATPDSVMALEPDALIIAVGSTPAVFPIKGIDGPNVQHATVAYTDLGSLADEIAVIGGGLVGCETALFMAGLGKKVTIIEMQSTLAPEANHMHREGMMQAFAKTDVKMETGLRCTEITTDGVYAMDSDNNQHFIPAKSVVYALGQRAVPCGDLMSLPIDQVFVVGDCKTVQKVSGGAFAAYHAAMDI